MDIRGRSRTLHINYRASHQIRMQADRQLAPKVSDVDGNVEERRGAVSMFNGPAPEITSFPAAELESAAAGAWLRQRIAEGIATQELGVFVRSPADLEAVYNTERHLLYVACTRARDQLMVSGVAPVSEFLDDLTNAR